MAEQTKDIEQMNIYQKLAAVQSIADTARKTKQGYNYTYSDINEILAKVTAGMKRYHLLLVPSIVPGTTEVVQNVVVNTKTAKTGHTYDQKVTEMLVKSDMIYTWINTDNPDERHEVPWIIAGSQADPSQAFGSGMTYCKRYFLINFFHISQNEKETDVDKFRSEQKAAMASEDIELAGQIISQVDLQIKLYLSDHQDDAEKVRAFVKKYVKSGDYFKIKESELAGKLLRDFMSEFIEKDTKKIEKDTKKEE